MEAITRVAFGLFGLAVLIGIAWLFSNNKRRVDWKLVITGVSLQVAFAALVLLVPGGKDVFDSIGRGFVKILSFVNAGSTFIFGNLMDVNTYGFIFAFQVLPTIIFFAALMGVLYHLGVMQAIVRAMAWVITSFQSTARLLFENSQTMPISTANPNRPKPIRPSASNMGFPADVKELRKPSRSAGAPSRRARS